MGRLHEPPPARVPRGRRLPRRHRHHPRGRLADVRRGDARGGERGRVPAQHLRLPSRAGERQPVGHRGPLGARTRARRTAARAHVPTALEPRHARPALLARSESRAARPRPPRPRRLVRRRPGAVALQAQPTRRRSDRPRGRLRRRTRARRHRQRLAAERGRRAPVLLARIQPAGRDALPDAARALSAVPLLGRRPHARNA